MIRDSPPLQKIIIISRRPFWDFEVFTLSFTISKFNEMVERAAENVCFEPNLHNEALRYKFPAQASKTRIVFPSIKFDKNANRSQKYVLHNLL